MGVVWPAPDFLKFTVLLPSTTFKGRKSLAVMFRGGHQQDKVKGLINNRQLYRILKQELKLRLIPAMKDPCKYGIDVGNIVYKQIYVERFFKIKILNTL